MERFLKVLALTALMTAGVTCLKPGPPPEGPFELENSIQTPGYAEGFIADSTYLYVASGEAGLTVIDISNLPDLEIAGRWDGVPPSDDYSFRVHKFTNDTLHRVYLANGDGNLKIIDVSVPDTPRFIMDGFWARNCEDVRGFQRADTQFILIARRDWGVALVQVGSDGNLMQRGGWVLVPGFTRGIAYSDSMLFVASGQDGVYVFDMSDVDHPSPITNYNTPGNARKVFPDLPYVYVADWHGGLIVLKLENDTLKFLAQREVDGVAKDVAVRDGYCFVASGNGGLEIFDVSDPSNPVFVQQIDDIGNALSVGFVKNYVTVGTRLGIYLISEKG